MLTKTSLIVFIIFLGQLVYIVMSESEKIKMLIKKKKIRFTPFFVARTKTWGVEVIVSYSVDCYTFIYFKIYFILIPYSMGSF